MTDIIITINPGSATIKLGVFACESGQARPLGRATVDEVAGTLRLQIGQSRSEHDLPSGAPASTMLNQALARLADRLPIRTPGAIAQRVVHGGDQFAGPAIIDHSVLAQIETLIPLAPLHPPNQHGDVCTLAAAITAWLARGASGAEAVPAAKAYVAGAMRKGIPLGRGHRPLDHFWETE